MSERLSKLPWVEIGILVLALLLRTAFLDIKPPHFDEGINGWFADQMKQNGYYHYDPTNYHGPLHFYAVFTSLNLFGRNVWALRLPAILASLLAIWALLRYQDFFGTTASRIAAAAMAVSPAYVFYGRYSIHESWMVFFCIAFLWGILGLWDCGTRKYLYAVVLGVTGMILTKETYILHLGCFALAALVLWLWQMVLPSKPAIRPVRQTWTWKELAISCALALLAIVFFYSGNFMDWKGLTGLYETFKAWFHTGVEAGGHEKNDFLILKNVDFHFLGVDGAKLSKHLNYYWVALMAQYELPALLGLICCLGYVFPSDGRLRYIAIATGGVLLAYSIVPYKTPWCIISIIWPFYLLLGAFISALKARLTKEETPILAAYISLLLLASLGQSIWLSFFHPTDEKEPYVYVQTYPEINTLTQPLLEMAKKDPRAYHLKGLVLINSYYPLPWILGDFTQTLYYSDQKPPAYDGDFIVVTKDKANEIESALTEDYYKKNFRLRNSMEDCIVYFRAKAFRDWFKGAPPEIVRQPPS